MSQISVPGTDIRIFEWKCVLDNLIFRLAFSSQSVLPQINNFDEKHLLHSLWNMCNLSG